MWFKMVFHDLWVLLNEPWWQRELVKVCNNVIAVARQKYRTTRQKYRRKLAIVNLILTLMIGVSVLVSLLGLLFVTFLASISSPCSCYCCCTPPSPSGTTLPKLSVFSWGSMVFTFYLWFWFLPLCLVVEHEILPLGNVPCADTAPCTQALRTLLTSILCPPPSRCHPCCPPCGPEWGILYFGLISLDFCHSYLTFWWTKDPPKL